MTAQTSSHNDNTTGGQPDPVEQALRTLREVGRSEKKALVPPGTPGANGGGQKRSRSEQSPEAKRKAEERVRKLAEGLRQHSVFTPDDADARELISHLAAKIKSKAMRKAVRAVLADPELVVIGRRVRCLSGNAGDQVRKLLRL
ncbi:hypothetical protein SAMN05443247_04550 [Bradyrhizobium erythrophlei]|nr:hypothetical protein SAMN05443247_04550 [Bradyrhizobium erythrophlei]